MNATPSEAAPVGAGDHTVRSGECVLTIAERAGHFWKTIWSHPDNTAVKNARKDPRVLLPGDRLTIPPLRERTETGQTEQRHRFRRRGVPYKLRIQFKTEGKPRADTPYVIEIDGRFLRGSTDTDGFLEAALPFAASRGTLRLGEPGKETVYDLDLAALAPADSIEGVQARLSNLGFLKGDASGRADAPTEAALRRFQAQAGLTVTGLPDGPTCEELHRRHGS